MENQALLGRTSAPDYQPPMELRTQQRLAPKPELSSHHMLSFSADITRFDAFQQAAGHPLAEEHLDLRILEFTRGISHIQTTSINRIAHLANRKACDLRIIFAPLDYPDNQTCRGLLSIFNHFQIPSSFLSERLQSTTHSFGANQDPTSGSQAAWFHFLCKNINVETNAKGRLEIVNQNIRSDTTRQSNADYSWVRAGFFLKFGPPGSPVISRQGSGSSTSTAVNGGGDSTITLICFGAHPTLEQRFRRMVIASAWESVLQDPYLVFDVVLDELYLQMDGLAWSLGSVFGGMEGRTFEGAQFPGHAADQIDFVGLHNVAKHVIYMREACEALTSTITSLLNHHNHLYPPPAHGQNFYPPPGSNLSPMTTASIGTPHTATRTAIEYRKGLVHSTNLRLSSLSKRMDNLISLSFNLVNQQDSRILQVDSRVMKTIAALTLLFLPATTVATVFSSTFFAPPQNAGEDGKPKLVVSNYFWVFWAVCVPLTMVVCGAGWAYYRRARRELILERQPMRRKGTWKASV